MELEGKRELYRVRVVNQLAVLLRMRINQIAPRVLHFSASILLGRGEGDMSPVRGTDNCILGDIAGFKLHSNHRTCVGH